MTCAARGRTSSLPVSKRAIHTQHATSRTSITSGPFRRSRFRASQDRKRTVRIRAGERGNYAITQIGGPRISKIVGRFLFTNRDATPYSTRARKAERQPDGNARNEVARTSLAITEQAGSGDLAAGSSWSDTFAERSRQRIALDE